MKDLRRNEFIDMLEMAEVLYEANEKFIKCDIPNLGSVTYYPKSDKLQINKTNSWMEYGFTFVKQFLELKGNTFGLIQPQETTSLVKIKEVKSDSELRNEFAGLALNGIMASGLANPTNQQQFDNIAEDSFRLADAMIKFSKL